MITNSKHSASISALVRLGITVNLSATSDFLCMLSMELVVYPKKDIDANSLSIDNNNEVAVWSCKLPYFSSQPGIR